MPTSTTVNNLKINKLTEAQYDAAVIAGTIGENELSFLTDADAGQVIQVSTLPTASADELDNIYQFIGTTDANYTNGYFYKCVSDGATPATYSWAQTDVQPASGGLPDQTGQSGKFLTTDGTDASWAAVDALPSQTGNSGKFLATNGTNASWSDSIIFNYNYYSIKIAGGSSSSSYNTTSVGWSTQASGSQSCCFGTDCKSKSAQSVAIGYYAVVESSATGAIQLGQGTNNVANTLKIKNYELLSADGTIPADRFTTTPSAAGNYTATIAVDGQGNVTRSWAQSVSQTVPSTPPELTVNGWSNNTQTITVAGVTSTNTVFVAPAPLSSADYADAGILCTAQNTNSLTFTCTTTPTNAITLSVVILG